MERRKHFFLTIIAALGCSLLLLCACGEKRSYVATSTGKTNEIILIINDNAHSRAIADTIREFLTQNDLYLPQPEALYDILTIPQQDFNNQAPIRNHHNLLMVNINDTIKERAYFSKDLWASPQLVLQFDANSDTSFYRMFRAHRRTVLEKLDQNELVRARGITDLGKNIGLSDEILNHFELYMSVPAGFQMVKKADDFLWFYQQRSDRKTEDMTASIMIWQRPYRAELQFSTDSLIRERNRVGRMYIAGPTDGSYMKTPTEYIYPQIKDLSDYAASGFAVEMRGLWDLEGDFMGGPFISYTFVHPKTQKLITIDAFLYRPNHDKRPILRQLQAVITDVSIPK
jgi:hypothetical protein